MFVKSNFVGTCYNHFKEVIQTNTHSICYYGEKKEEQSINNPCYYSLSETMHEILGKHLSDLPWKCIQPKSIHYKSMSEKQNAQ